jgi:integrase
VKLPPNRVALTPLFVKAIKPRDGRATNYWDARCAGLCLRVQKSGFRSYKYVYSLGARRVRWYHVGPASIGLANARRIADRLRVAVAEGKDPHGERRAERAADTFQMLADRYLEEHAKKRNRSWRKGRHLVERFALPAWKDRPARSVSRGDVRALISKVKSPSVANAASKIEKHPQRSRARVLSDSELPLIWQALDSMATVEARACQAILITGQRPGEVLRMRAEHVKDGAWCMQGAPDPAAGWPGTKNSQDHRVPLPPPVLDAVNGCKSGFVFDPKGRLDLTMKKACSLAGITDRVRPHDLRQRSARRSASWAIADKV